MAWYDIYQPKAPAKKKKTAQPIRGSVDFSGAALPPSELIRLGRLKKFQPIQQQPSLPQRAFGGLQQFGEGARVPIQSLLDLFKRVSPISAPGIYSELLKRIPHAPTPQTTTGKISRIAGRIAGELPAFAAADIGAAGVLGKIAPKVAKTGLGALERAGLSFGAVGQLEPGTIEERLKRIPRDIATGVITAGVGQLATKALLKYKSAKGIGKTIEKELPGIKPISKELEPLAKEARKYKSAEEFVKGQFSKKPEYGIGHRPSYEGMPPAHNLLEGETLPRDVYTHPDFSISSGRIRSGDKAANESWSALQKIKNNPDAEITVYRAGAKNELNNGDWITFSKDYAKQSLEGTDKVHSFKIKAKDAIFAGDDINEFGYYPKSQLTDIYNQATKGVKPTLSEGRLTEQIAQPQIIDPIQKIIQALKEAKPIRAGQEALYSEARSKRIGSAIAIGKKVEGEKGLYAQLGALKGELPKAHFESIRKSIGQDDIDYLFNKIENHPAISGFENITTKQGLAKLLGQQGGQVPTHGEINLLNKVFGEDFTKTILDKRPLLAKFSEAGIQAWNLPKSIMASTDLSAPLRQGAFLIGRPKQFLPAFVNMFRYAGSEKAYQDLEKNITQRPTYALMKKGKLVLTEIGSQLDQREEAMLSNWGEKIPIFKYIARGSNRAYTGFLNKLRADVFDDLIAKATRQGLDPVKNELLLKNISSFVNNATGRGNLGALEKSSLLLNNALFSPRLIASRLTLLNPVYYAKLDPFTRKEALKSLFTFAGTALTITQLAKMGGAKIGADPRSSDFMKIKIGTTRIDTLAGFQQYIRSAAQIITGKYISSTTGKEYNLGEGYKPMTRLSIGGKILESKLSPTMSFAVNLLRGQDVMGQKIQPSKEIISRFIPLVVQDVYDLYKEGGLKELPLGTLAVFGTGLQTYGAKPPKKDLPTTINDYLIQRFLRK